MRDIRLKALDVFWQKPTPSWGGDLSHLDFNGIHYYMRAADRQGKTWDDVPAEIKNTFDKLGIPEADRKFLAGVGASTSRRSSTTASARTCRKGSSSSIPIPHFASIPTWSGSASGR